MSDEAALLAAILAHPDEDTPRLMYADWLQENGQPDRAEFIRLECRIARATEIDPADDARWYELSQIADRENWLGNLPQFEDAQWDFRRGMPEELAIRGEQFLTDYQRIVEIPGLRELYLYDMWNGQVEDLARCRWNPNWIALRLQEDPKTGILVYAYDSTPSLIAIANCPQARQLRKLQFSMFSLTVAGLHALTESPYLDQLEELALDGDVTEFEFQALRNRFGTRLVGKPF